MTLFFNSYLKCYRYKLEVETQVSFYYTIFHTNVSQIESLLFSFVLKSTNNPNYIIHAKIVAIKTGTDKSMDSLLRVNNESLITYIQVTLKVLIA